MTTAGTAPPVLVLATENPGKLRELRRLLAPRRLTLVSLRDAGFHGDLAETGDTYAENALAKAVTACTQLGRPVLADDSGIEVDAVHGWPGPLSARWMGPAADDDDRLHGLIDEVDRRCPGRRQVRYVCVAALCLPDAEPVTARGECVGTLASPRGTAGFGYDPAFLSDDLGMTFGEAPDGAKDRVSHRARALRRLGEASLFETLLQGS
ncbi:MAG: non-canonical purine NTP pyrophosphatase [Candidatus Dormibacteraeota bacterium]|nr:non-canonical purine NTP pyrophosphatase [Candidatus Dormibacteraeota bacterium]